jgi:hypothetical protein
MPDQDSRPSFYETCVKYYIDFSALLNDLVVHGVHERINCQGASLFFHHGIGELALVDAMLGALSRLSATICDRSNIGQITIVEAIQGIEVLDARNTTAF